MTLKKENIILVSGLFITLNMTALTADQREDWTNFIGEISNEQDKNPNFELCPPEGWPPTDYLPETFRNSYPPKGWPPTNYLPQAFQSNIPYPSLGWPPKNDLPPAYENNNYCVLKAPIAKPQEELKAPGDGISVFNNPFIIDWTSESNSRFYSNPCSTLGNDPYAGLIAPTVQGLWRQAELNRGLDESFMEAQAHKVVENKQEINNKFEAKYMNAISRLSDLLEKIKPEDFQTKLLAEEFQILGEFEKRKLSQIEAEQIIYWWTNEYSLSQ